MTGGMFPVGAVGDVGVVGAVGAVVVRSATLIQDTGTIRLTTTKRSSAYSILLRFNSNLLLFVIYYGANVTSNMASGHSM